MSNPTSSYHIGVRYWIPDEDQAWVVGLLRAIDSNSKTLDFSVTTAANAGAATTTTSKLITLAELRGTKLDPCGSHIDDHVENLVDLDELSEGAILHHVRLRFVKKMIYTHVGSILVAVNPFEDLNIYGDRDIRRAQETSAPFPHVFVTAATAYQQLQTNGKNQSVLISGESGAGKTETTKKVLTYLATVAPDSKPKKAGEPGVETKILQSNPLLEALGNAKTLRNNNSSRFGKWMKVGFDRAFKIQGCEIINYLLEKSRVVVQNTNERNYHIFYQLIAGADASLKAKLKLRSANDYNYLNQSGCLKINGVDDAMEFRDVLEAMQTLQFPSHTVEHILKILSSILLLGNIDFEGVNGDVETAKLAAKSDEAMKQSAELLGLDLTTYNYSLTNKRVQMGRGSVVSMKLSVSQALDSRDTLAKSLYSNLFDWTIQRVNLTLKTENSPFSIGILDIFGFEVFDLNSFEQLCINYANEKLQFHFNEVIFSEEMSMYQEEKVPLDKVVFEDNGECVNLIEGKPYGLLSLLEEECSLGNATDLTYISKLEKTFGTGKPTANKFFLKNKTKPDCFSVVHFAGAVEYNVANFLDKNRDSMSVTSKEVMMSSQISLVSELFQDKVAEGASSGGKESRKGSASATKSTLGGQFRNQLIGLIATLKTTEPHFIRCVKPNHEKVGGKFDGHLALRQLRYAGLFEAIRIRKSGFAYRATFAVFANTYQLIVKGLSVKRRNKLLSDADACVSILQQMTDEGKIKREDWQVGCRTRVFLKTNHDRVLLERERASRLVAYAVKIQVLVRGAVERWRRRREKMINDKEMAIKVDSIGKQVTAAIVVQKYWRRKSIQLLMKSMGKFIELRRVLMRKETHRVRDILTKIEAELPPDVRSATAIVAAPAMIPMGATTNMSRKDRAKFKKMEEARLAQQHLIWAIFAHEIKVARVMMKVIEVQDTLIEQLRYAIQDNNVKELNRLILKSEKLEMNGHPLVVEGKAIVMKLFRKQQIMKMLINFLKNEEEYHENVIQYVEEGKKLDIDSEFLYKVQQIYENAGPRLKTRNRLRNMIELCNRYGIEQACLEVFTIRKQHSRFAEIELRSARLMLKLLDMDEQLFPTGQGHPDERSHNFAHRDESDDDDEEGGEQNADGNDLYDIKDLKDDKSEGALLWGRRTLSTPSGSKLTPEIIDICSIISETTVASIARKHKQRLQKAIGGSIHKVYACIRYFKWSKSLCAWKYPEIVEGQAETQPDPIFIKSTNTLTKNSMSSPGAGLSAIFGGGSMGLASSSPNHPRGQSAANDNYSDDESTDDGSNSVYDEDVGTEEFFGMRFRETRSNPYIIRSLHQDFDMYAQKSTNGEMEAAIGNISLTQSVQETLKEVDAVNNIDLKISLPNGTTYDKTAKRQVKSQSPDQHMNSSLGRSGKSQLFLPGTLTLGAKSSAAANWKDKRKESMPEVPIKRVEELHDSNMEKQLHLSRTRKKQEFGRLAKEAERLKRFTPGQAWH